MEGARAKLSVLGRTLTSLGLGFSQALEQCASVIRDSGVGHHYPVHERPGGTVVKNADWNQSAAVLSHLLPLHSCVTSGNSLNLSEPPINKWG